MKSRRSDCCASIKRCIWRSWLSVSWPLVDTPRYMPARRIGLPWLFTAKLRLRRTGADRSQEWLLTPLYNSGLLALLVSRRRAVPWRLITRARWPTSLAFGLAAVKLGDISGLQACSQAIAGRPSCAFWAFCEARPRRSLGSLSSEDGSISDQSWLGRRSRSAGGLRTTGCGASRRRSSILAN